MDLNRRPPPYKGGALTAELYAHKNGSGYIPTRTGDLYDVDVAL